MQRDSLCHPDFISINILFNILLNLQSDLQYVFIERFPQLMQLSLCNPNFIFINISLNILLPYFIPIIIFKDHANTLSLTIPIWKNMS